jgi:hypothetical protein
VKRLVAGALAMCLVAGCAAPIVPQRSKPGGSARWAEAIAFQRALTWSPNAHLYRIAGAGVGTDGWLPDRGGTWELDYWSESEKTVLAINIDSDGAARTHETPAAAPRESTLPPDWEDSPKVWLAARRHSKQEPVHTFDAELAFDAEPQRYPGRPVWRIRFWQPDNTYETHVVSIDAGWLTSY